METINTTQFNFAPYPGRINFPGHTLTLILKGTFDLVQGQAAIPSKEQLFPTGDEFFPDDVDMQGSCRYESDFAYFKPKADLLLSGHCHSPNNKPVSACQVRFQVGSHEKTLTVFGDRQWKRSFGIRTITDPEPFTRMALKYENSFGGPGFKKNPVGKGFTKQKTKEGKNVRLLPNIEDPAHIIGSPRNKPAPAGFGPLGKMWEQRLNKLGTYRGKYLKERWPWFPGDFSYDYFNAASPDMQVEEYLKGDEELFFENMHPEQSRFLSGLPGIRVRCFINRQIDPASDDTEFKEVSMNLDTLWADMDNEKLILVWRGVTEIQTEEYEELLHTFIIYEPLEKQPASLENCREMFLAAITEEEEELEEPEEPEERAEEPEITLPEDEIPEEDKKEETPKPGDLKKMIKAQSSAILARLGIDMKNLPPEAREKIEKDQDSALEKLLETDPEKKMAMEMEEHKGQMSEALSKLGLDMDNLPPLSEKAKKEQLRMFAELGMSDPAILQSPEIANIFNIFGAVMPKMGIDPENLETFIGEAKKQQKKIKNQLGIEEDDESAKEEKPEEETPSALTREIVKERADRNESFAGEDLKGIDLSNLDLKGVDFSGAILSGVMMCNSDLTNTNFTDATMVEADLSGSNLTGAVLKGTDLSGAGLAKAVLKNSDHSGANLTGAVLSESNMEDVNLTGANLSGADLKKANLKKACLKEADFTEADMPGADLSGADLGEAIFEKTKLNGSTLINIQAVGGNFSEADLTGANLSNSDFSKADLSKSIIDETDFSGSKLEDASVEGARGVRINFTKADLTRLRASEGCDFSHGTFREATGPESIWHDAVLKDTDFSLSRMQGADFTKACLMNANFSAADMKYARFRKADMKLAKLLYINLFEGSLEKADLTGADLSGSNMYGVEFLDAIMDHTKMEYTNIKMTKLG